jgi:UDP-3-O-[3-hydroxymyristoyl] N-acetylglucosamine deacetylase/3-hydroxyacyl-[acyl-carrier-protein] dehydratase
LPHDFLKYLVEQLGKVLPQVLHPLQNKHLNDTQLKDLSSKIGIEGKINLGENGILNNKQLRFRNEPVRHKLLDLIGDLALIGAPLKAQILAARPGHKANVEFAKYTKLDVTNFLNNI